MAVEATESPIPQCEPCAEDGARYRWSVRGSEHVLGVTLRLPARCDRGAGLGRRAMRDAAALRRDTEG